MEEIQVHMLGEFSLISGESRICDMDTRSKKVWSLLAYLIHCRGKTISRQRLIDLLWGDHSSDNPENALRITLHRARTLLNRLRPGAGPELILCREGGYAWNSTVPLRVDCDRFEALYQADAPDPEHRLEQLLEALALYRGPFLPRQSSELWVTPINTHFSSLFLLMTIEAANLLSMQGRHREAADLCRTAAAVEIYHEPLHQLLMQELTAAGDQKGAAAVYDDLSRRLFDDFGIRPSEETKTVYRKVACSLEDRPLPMDEILEHLQEPAGENGALQCDYDYFQMLCRAESRTLEFRGGASHMAVLQVTRPGNPLSRRSMRRIMEQFGEVLRSNLRRGDIISRCSTSQYVILLPHVNYEDSCMVCRRVISVFRQMHPHVSAEIQFHVQSLCFGIQVP